MSKVVIQKEKGMPSGSLTLGILALVGFIISAFLWFDHSKKTKPVTFSSPFRLLPALEFAVLFGLVLFFSKVAANYSSSLGIYLTSFFSGFVDMDAITISMASLAGNGISTDLATRAIMIAALTNTMIKAGIAYVFGARRFAWHLFLFMLIILVVGLGLFFVVEKTFL